MGIGNKPIDDGNYLLPQKKNANSLGKNRLHGSFSADGLARWNLSTELSVGVFGSANVPLPNFGKCRKFWSV